jgi:hypothetical protein
MPTTGPELDIQNLDVSIFLAKNGFIVRTYTGDSNINYVVDSAYVFNSFEQMVGWLQARFAAQKYSREEPGPKERDYYGGSMSTDAGLR